MDDQRPASVLFSAVYQDLGRPIRHLVLDEVRHDWGGTTHAGVKELHYSGIAIVSCAFCFNKCRDIFGQIHLMSQTLQDFQRVIGRSPRSTANRELEASKRSQFTS